MVISIIVTSVVVIIIVKKCKKTHETQKPSVNQLATTNNSIGADVKTERNPAYVQMESNPANNNIMNMEMENNSTDAKMQCDPAYQIMQKDDSRTDEDDYYY